MYKSLCHELEQGTTCINKEKGEEEEGWEEEEIEPVFRSSSSKMIM